MAELLPCSKVSLFTAVINGNEDAVTLLLKQWHDLEVLDQISYTVLHHACSYGHHGIAKLLLDAGACVHAVVPYNGKTALHLAARCGRVEIVSLLLKRGACVNMVDRHGWTSLHEAARFSYSENIVKELLIYEAHIDAVNDRGDTPLSFAILWGVTHIANMLIRSGANVRWRNGQGQKIVHLAARKGCIETIQLISKLNVDFNIADGDDMTPLHIACNSGHLGMAKFFLETGAEVNSPCCRNGFTSLHFAVRKKSVQTVELLLNHKADVNIKDKEGLTPLVRALKTNCKEMIQLFAKHLVQMKAQNLFVSEWNLKTISENNDARIFSESCENEIERMRKNVISNTTVKVSDIFTKSVNRLADFMTNEHVEQMLESGNYSSKFPIYATVIRDRFLEGKERRDLLRQSSDWMWTVINEFCELPYICVERINRCLTNRDLALQMSKEPSQQTTESVSCTEVATTSFIPTLRNLKRSAEIGFETPNKSRRA